MNTDIIPIYTVLGKSGSGKSCAVNILCNNEEIPFKKIKPYTTRPKRNSCDDDYYFMTRSIFDMYTSTDEIIKRYIKDETVISDISYNVAGNKVWRYILTYNYNNIFNYRHDNINIVFAASIGQFMDMYSYYKLSKYLYTDKPIIKPIPVVIEPITNDAKLKNLYNRATSDKDYKEILRRYLFGDEIPDNYIELFKDLGYNENEIYVVHNDYTINGLKSNLSTKFLDILFPEKMWDRINSNYHDDSIR